MIKLGQKVRDEIPVWRVSSLAGLSICSDATNTALRQPPKMVMSPILNGLMMVALRSSVMAFYQARCRPTSQVALIGTARDREGAMADNTIRYIPRRPMQQEPLTLREIVGAILFCIIVMIKYD